MFICALYCPIAVSCSGVGWVPGVGPAGLVGGWFIGPESRMPLRALIASSAPAWAMPRASEPFFIRAESSSRRSLIAANFATMAIPAWPSISLSTLRPLSRMLRETSSSSLELRDQLVDTSPIDSSSAELSACCSVSR